MKAPGMLREDFGSLRNDLRALRDELRLKMHLARMDLKDEWEKLQPQADRALTEVGDEAVKAAQDLKKRFLELREELKKS